MHFVEFMQVNGHQELAVWTDPAVGLKAFIAIHDTTLGPSMGGTRIWPHATDDDAIMDVLRLSKAMTYKSAAAEADSTAWPPAAPPLWPPSAPTARARRTICR